MIIIFVLLRQNFVEQSDSSMLTKQSILEAQSALYPLVAVIMRNIYQHYQLAHILVQFLVFSKGQWRPEELDQKNNAIKFEN